MSQIFTIQDDKVVIKKLSLETLEGDLTIAGTLTVDSLTVLNDTTFGIAQISTIKYIATRKNFFIAISFYF